MNATSCNTATLNSEAPAAAHKALAFAHGHDWGRHAFLRQAPYTGIWTLYGLVDSWTKDGEHHTASAAIPATLTAAREFGGY